MALTDKNLKRGSIRIERFACLMFQSEKKNVIFI